MSSHAPTPAPRDVLKLLAPLGLVAAVFAALGRLGPAVALLAMGAAGANAVALRPSLVAAAQRGEAALVRGVRTGLFAVVGALPFVLFILPAWFVRWVLRKRSLSAPGWTVRGAPTTRKPMSKRLFAPELHQASAVQRWRRTALGVVGLVSLMLLADTGAGLAWEHVRPAGASKPLARVQEPLGSASKEPDPRADTEAMADAPWRTAYFAELRSVRTNYWPYLLTRPARFDGTYINVDGWERKTWKGAATEEPRPIVWLFGGSVAWGEGQRDDHTIASEVAKLAAEDDLPIDARSLGQRGWVSYQEVTLYDQLLIDPAQAKPDLALFLDGPAEVAVQSQLLPGGASSADLAVPMHFGIERSQQLTRQTASTKSAAAASPVRDAWDAYLRHSLVAKAMRGTRGLAGEQAGASTAAPERDANPRSGSGSCSAGCPQSWDASDITPAAIDKAVAVYRQNRALALDISRRREVTARFFWQPALLDGTGYRAAARRVGAPTIDLTDLHDGHQGRYLDLENTNEAGAHEVAVAIYDSIRPDLERWYRSHD